jgi:uroporphyrinogen decarboxylase
MTSRERLLTVLRGGIPDCVPVAPDISNMIPARMTGKPFWDIYLYKNPPSWMAYIEAVKHFGFDSLMDGYVPIALDCDINPDAPLVTVVIVDQNEERIVTQGYTEEGGKKQWLDTVMVYRIADPPAGHVNPTDIGLPPVPKQWRPVEGVKEWPTGGELLKLAKEMMGDHGLVGVACGTSNLIGNEKNLYDYFDNPKKYHALAEEVLEKSERRFHALMALETPPDFICTGGSGTLIYQTPRMTRELTLPIIKRMAELAAEAGIPSHIHSCGPEKELIKMCAEETQLTVIDPLEIPPMGDCVLKDIKKLYGDRLVLKGNLHTTEVMLRGTPDDVRHAARQAIRDGAAGGRFILSTGDQCGRDTPDENLFAMIETAREYGRYW